MSNEILKKNTTSAWIWAILGMIYAISPVDIIPDMPVVGWVDDFFIMTATGLNLIEKQFAETDSYFAHVLIMLKRITIILGIIMVVLILVLGTMIINLFAK